MFTKDRLVYTLLPIILLNCYTFEFHPTPEYPNLRRDNIRKVTLTSIRPTEEIVTLGTLVIHDFSGNINEPSFQHAIKREVKKRGAEGAWITKINLKRTVHLQGGASSNNREYMQKNYYNSSQIEGTIGIVEVVLFNYLQSAK